MAKQTKEEIKSIVKPLVRFGDQKHVLEEIMESKDVPTMKAVGFTSIMDAPNSFISYVVTFKGREVLSIEVDEPNLKAIAEESAKIAFVNEFVDQE